MNHDGMMPAVDEEEVEEIGRAYGSGAIERADAISRLMLLGFTEPAANRICDRALMP